MHRGRRRRRRSFGGLALAASLLIGPILDGGIVAPRVALADDRALAKLYFQRGRTHFELGEFSEALDAFKEAYRAADEPAILFNIAQCHRQLGQREEAIRTFRAYLNRRPQAPNRAEVLEIIDRLSAGTAPSPGKLQTIDPYTEAPRSAAPAPSATPTQPANGSPSTAGTDGDAGSVTVYDPWNRKVTRVPASGARPSANAPQTTFSPTPGPTPTMLPAPSLTDEAAPYGQPTRPAGIATPLLASKGPAQRTLGKGARVVGGAVPMAIAAADLDGDGRADLVTAHRGADDVAVHLARGGGAWETHRMRAGTDPVHVAIADLDGDGKLDLVVAARGSSQVFLFRGRGGGMFEDGRPLVGGPGAAAVVVADLDGDGKLDLAAADLEGDLVSLWYGASRGGLFARAGGGDDLATPDLQIPVGHVPVALAAADWNGDGRLDLAAAALDGNEVTILYNAGGGRFRPSAQRLPVPGPRSLAVADLNGDGRPDLAAASSVSNSVYVLLNRGAQFAEPRAVPAGRDPTCVAAADLDGDGVADLAVANRTGAAVQLLYGRGDGTFDAAKKAAAGAGTIALTVVDLDGDGLLDVATADHGASTITVLPAQPR